jgi:hypothetical protein
MGRNQNGGSFLLRSGLLPGVKSEVKSEVAVKVEDGDIAIHPDVKKEAGDGVKGEGQRGGNAPHA